MLGDIMRHNTTLRHRGFSGSPSDEELIKYKKHADGLEQAQRQRFNDSDDPFTFFESAFEQDVRDDLAGYRAFIKNALEQKEIEAQQKKCAECMEGTDSY
jgi:hypothetical protein